LNNGELGPSRAPFLHPSSPPGEGGVLIAVPNKGRLKQPVLKLLEQAGIEPALDEASRSLVVPTNREEIRLVYLRPEDIPGIVASGAVHLGITGHDLVVEYGARVVEEVDLQLGRARLVLAVPRETGVERPEDLPPGTRVATKFVNITRRYLEEKGISASILRISGAAEVMPRLGAADAVVDVASTGTTLRLHGLQVIDVLLETSARLIRSPSVPREEPLVEEVIMNVRSVVQARGAKLVLMNVPDDRLLDVLAVLPSMGGPSISRITGGDKPMWEVIIAVTTDKLNRAIVEAKKNGARDIVVINLERVIP